jgi:organic radical activating enzyme
MAISHYFRNAQEMRVKLDSISPSLCLAKWLQVTLHLHNGTTHSCHHPAPHKIPLNEINRDPSALHNTTTKKTYRKQMLQGIRPKECEYCWNVEDSSDALSDRHLKSAESWARGHFDNILKLDWKENVLPTYLEISFSNQCNFKCSYCSPQISSSWLKEIRDSGPYTLVGGKKHHDLSYLSSAGIMPIDEDDNPYIKAFWEWWPKVYPNLKVLRITGGEPLLSPNLYRILQWIIDNPRPDLDFAINTNLGVPDQTINKFLNSVEALCHGKKLAQFTLFTSVDSSGTQAEYIRHGLSYPRLIRNVDRVFETVPNVHVVFMCTFNALSVTGFHGLLEQVLEFRNRYSTLELRRLWLDIAYLRYPPWQSVKILTPNYIDLLENDLRFMLSVEDSGNKSNKGFQDVEIEKMRRLIDFAKAKTEAYWLKEARQNFYYFFSQHDQIRGTNFLQTFPQMHDFWSVCRNLTI